jgi:hypothetical protein
VQRTQRKWCALNFYYNFVTESGLIHNQQFVTLELDTVTKMFQAAAAEDGYYVIVNRMPTCEAGTAVVITSNSTKFTVDGDGSAKVL